MISVGWAVSTSSSESDSTAFLMVASLRFGWSLSLRSVRAMIIARTLRKLKDQPNLNEATIKKAVESLSLELVLTAHPTEITRRTPHR